MLSPKKLSRREVHLKAGKWTTVAVNKSLRLAYVYVEVWAPRTAKWRRIGIFPGFGRFKQYLSVAMPPGIVQVKIRENRTCTVMVGHSAETVLPDQPAEKTEA